MLPPHDSVSNWHRFHAKGPNIVSCPGPRRAVHLENSLAQGFEVRLTVATPTAQDFEDPWGWTCGRRLRRRLPGDHPAAKDIGNRPDVPVGSIYFDQKLTTVTGEL